MEEEPLDSRGRNITLAIFGLIALVIIALVVNNYRTKAGWIRGLKSDNVAARKAAAEAMMRKGQMAEMLQGDRPSVRSAAVRGLGLVGTTEAVEQLIQFFKDPDPPIKEQAKQAVVAIGPDIAMAPTAQALGDSDESVRGNADGAMRAWGAVSIPHAAPKLVDPDARNTAATNLTEIGKQNPENAGKVIEAVVAYLDPKTEGVDEVVQVRVVGILDGIPDPRGVPYLIDMLKYEHTQRAAVGALGRKADKRATLPLLPILNNPLIRTETVIALGKIADPRAVPELVKLLGSYSAELRIATAEALRSIGRPAVPALLVAARSQDPYARASAVSALGGIDDPAAQAAALAALKDRDPNVRVAAATSLRRRPSAAAIPALVAAFDDPDGRVSDAAAETLAVIGAEAPGGKAVTAPLIASLDVSANPARAYYAGRALRLLGGQTAVSALINTLDHPDPDVASAAARILGDLGSPAALKALQTTAARSTHPEVRWAAQRSAARLSGAETS